MQKCPVRSSSSNRKKRKSRSHRRKSRSRHKSRAKRSERSERSEKRRDRRKDRKRRSSTASRKDQKRKRSRSRSVRQSPKKFVTKGMNAFEDPRSPSPPNKASKPDGAGVGLSQLNSALHSLEALLQEPKEKPSEMKPMQNPLQKPVDLPQTQLEKPAPAVPKPASLGLPKKPQVLDWRRRSTTETKPAPQQENRAAQQDFALRAHA
eukprot:s1592_g1.t1